VLLELGLERGGAGRCAQAAALERLLTMQFGEPVLQAADVLGQPPVGLVQVGVRRRMVRKVVADTP
jgi:hypothetical protein